jgi:hypothetical protein
MKRSPKSCKQPPTPFKGSPPATTNPSYYKREPIRVGTPARFFIAMTTAPTKTKRKPKPLALAPPPTIPAPKDPTPPQRPVGEMEALAANFQYLSDRVGDVTHYNDLPPNAHEFLTRTQQAINNLAIYTRKVRDRDLREYRETLASHRVSLLCKISFVGLLTVFLCGLISSFEQETHVQPYQNRVPPTVPTGTANGAQLYPP